MLSLLKLMLCKDDPAVDFDGKEIKKEILTFDRQKFILPLSGLK